MLRRRSGTQSKKLMKNINMIFERKFDENSHKYMNFDTFWMVLLFFLVREKKEDSESMSYGCSV